MITKNFRLNALANQYAAALYNHITATSHGDYFMIDAGGELVRVEIAGGVKGVRPHRRLRAGGAERTLPAVGKRRDRAA